MENTKYQCIMCEGSGIWKLGPDPGVIGTINCEFCGGLGYIERTIEHQKLAEEIVNSIKDGDIIDITEWAESLSKDISEGDD